MAYLPGNGVNQTVFSRVRVYEEPCIQCKHVTLHFGRQTLKQQTKTTCWLNNENKPGFSLSFQPSSSSLRYPRHSPRRSYLDLLFLLPRPYPQVRLPFSPSLFF